jgi:hypothetical protein
MGRFSMTSNSWDNIDMWARFDMAELDPKIYLSLQLKTQDNKSLDDRQLEDMKRRVTDGDYDRWLEGGRPAPIGTEFSARAIEAAKIDWLDQIMDYLRQSDGKRVCPKCHIVTELEHCPECNLDLMEILPVHSDIYYSEAPRAGIVEWALPYDDKRTYIIVGDPGQGNAPKRNAPVITVWDVTEFEQKDGMATLRAFWWGFGNGKYEPFIEKYLHYKYRYACLAATFDNTGTQQSFDTMFNLLEEEFVMGTALSGPNKNHALVSLKLLLERQKIGWAGQIKGVGQQLGSYRLPDTKIAQDIVSTMMILSLWLRRYYYAGFPGQDETDTLDAPMETERHYSHDGSRNRARSSPRTA